MNRENMTGRIVWSVGQYNTRRASRLPRLVGLALSMAGLMGFAGLGPGADHSLAAAECVTSSGPQTVEDYYLQLPDQYLMVRGAAADRLKAVQTRDMQNDYLRITGNWDGFTEIGLFRAPDRSVVVGVSHVQFSPGVQQQLTFLSLKDGTWTDRTAEVFPAISSGRLLSAYLALKPTEEAGFDGEPPTYFRLPQGGTTVRAVSAPEMNARELTLLELSWRNGRFVAPGAPPPLMAGSWAASSKEGASFELSIKQEGRALSGFWVYAAMPAAMPVSGKLTGTVRDGYAEVEIEPAEIYTATGTPSASRSGSQPAELKASAPVSAPGRAIMVRAGNDAYWKLTAAVGGGLTLPVAMRLKPSSAVASNVAPSQTSCAASPVAASGLASSVASGDSQANRLANAK